MPDLSCLGYSDFRDVYEPNEDTYLLIDALSLEIKEFGQNKMSVLEVGVGSGAVITSVALLMQKNGNKDSMFIGTDINPLAIACAQRVAEINKVDIKFVETKFADRLDEQFDVLIFNPPYVVTSEEELADAQDKKGIAAAWAGGL